MHTNLWPLSKEGEGELSSLHNINQTCLLVSTALAISFLSVFPEIMVLHLPLVGNSAVGSGLHLTVVAAVVLAVLLVCLLPVCSLSFAYH